MTSNRQLGIFKYFVHDFNRSGEDKTVFTWVDDIGYMTIVSVDWIQKGKLRPNL